MTMGLGGTLLVVTGVVVVFVNVVATLRLWRSTIFERPQKVAQTILVWLVPGSVIIVWNLLGASVESAYNVTQPLAAPRSSQPIGFWVRRATVEAMPGTTIRTAMEAGTTAITVTAAKVAAAGTMREAALGATVEAGIRERGPSAAG